MIDEFVLRGNSATLKCLVPSFVADFITVESWVDEDNVEFMRAESNDLMGNFSCVEEKEVNNISKLVRKRFALVGCQLTYLFV